MKKVLMVELMRLDLLDVSGVREERLKNDSESSSSGSCVYGNG